ncbi:MAG: hypothetical protein O6761_01605 [Thaumarchaeota archaeon]|nr:hypothetical protein [Nitrososphaerota archaeon]
MNPQIGISSLSVNRSEDEVAFVKYDIDVSLEEIESTETQTKIKYGFTLLTNPKNVRIAVEGFATINGTQLEKTRFLESDKNNIPHLVHTVYHELFPLFYIISKSMNIPCPAHNLALISQASVDKVTQESSSETDVTEVAINEQEKQESVESQSQSNEQNKTKEQQTKEDLTIKEPTVSSN